MLKFPLAVVPVLMNCRPRCWRLSSITWMSNQNVAARSPKAITTRFTIFLWCGRLVSASATGTFIISTSSDVHQRDALARHLDSLVGVQTVVTARFRVRERPRLAAGARHPVPALRSRSNFEGEILSLPLLQACRRRDRQGLSTASAPPSLRTCEPTMLATVDDLEPICLRSSFIGVGARVLDLIEYFLAVGSVRGSTSFLDS